MKSHRDRRARAELSVTLLGVPAAVLAPLAASSYMTGANLVLDGTLIALRRVCPTGTPCR